MRRQFSAAKSLWALHVALEVIRLALGLYLLAGGRRILVAGAASLVVPILSFFVRRFADESRGIAERMRRLVLFQDGTGRAPSRAELLELRADATWLPDLDPPPIGAYYASTLPAGPQRLAHLGEEAAFHTRGYAKTASFVSFFVAGCGVVAAVLFLWASLQAGSAPADAGMAARLAAAVLTFFAAGTFAQFGFAFASLSVVAHRTFDRLDKLSLSADVALADVLVAMIPYECALAKSPPIPSLVYRILRSRLDEAWKRHGLCQ